MGVSSGSHSISLDDVADRASAAASVRFGTSRVTDLRPLDGGLSSITVAATMRPEAGPSERIVLKIAPPGLEPVRSRDVLRQARLLQLLAGADGLAVPAVLFTDEGRPPAVPPLFAMQFVEGDSFEPVNGDDPLPPPATIERRALAAAAMLARLHKVPMRSPTLRGEEAVALDAEVHRWDRALETVDEDLSRGHGECADRLLAQLPETVAPTLCHGDWRLGNMLCTGASIAAVIDWEIWSVADPRVDLAWFLGATVSAGNVFAVREVPGMPSRERLLAQYEAVLGRSVGDLEWFTALNDLKACAAMGLILKRNRRQPEPDPAIEAHAPRLAALIVRALDGLSVHEATR